MAWKIAMPRRSNESIGYQAVKSMVCCEEGEILRLEELAQVRP